jgi:hypothetical protein
VEGGEESMRRRGGGKVRRSWEGWAGEWRVGTEGGRILQGDVGSSRNRGRAVPDGEAVRGEQPLGWMGMGEQTVGLRWGGAREGDRKKGVRLRWGQQWKRSRGEVWRSLFSIINEVK